MKTAALALILSLALNVHAEDKIKMNFVNEEVTKVIESYSKSTGQKFVVDSTVRGKISILAPDAMTPAEAFSELSSALAVNGFAISTQGDTMVVVNARAAQRSLLPVLTERPELKPERMVTWIYTPKYVMADSVMRDIRTFTSSFGEMTTGPGNQLILTDWTSSLNRVADILKEIDKPMDPATTKAVANAKKETRNASKGTLLTKEIKKEEKK